jgi:hypothetical protein
MLCGEPVDHISPAADDISNHAAAGLPRECVDHFARKARRKSREGSVEVDTGDLPVASSAVLSGRCGAHRTPRADGIAAPAHSVDWSDISEAEPLEPRQGETTTRPRNVSECVAPGIAVFRRIRCLTDSDAIENDDGSALQPRSPV